ncbi:hypothetical protein G3I77_10925 [Streptomyces sp. D2-8]|uniref:hypothetical protein n=1 Tax=Streptomyces sp. D2-8 TaxID=2707767 RepID=UPI0020BE73F9|nr:hypothetical protein [Streptomyces sp. D2-8]MCK8433532.1 hypothetical protein [Streptomyces sp. D2-8]
MPEDRGGLRGGAGWSQDHLGYGTLTYTGTRSAGAAREARTADDASGSAAGGGASALLGGLLLLRTTCGFALLAWTTGPHGRGRSRTAGRRHPLCRAVCGRMPARAGPVPLPLVAALAH